MVAPSVKLPIATERTSRDPNAFAKAKESMDISGGAPAAREHDSGLAPVEFPDAFSAPLIADPPPCSSHAYPDASDSHQITDRHPNRYPAKRTRSSPPPSDSLLSPSPTSGLDASVDRSSASFCEEHNGHPQSDNYDFPLARHGTTDSLTFQNNASVKGACAFPGDLGGSVAAESPPAHVSSNNMLRGRGTGSIFFKTKLCCKFRTGTCPYNSSCNFAHGTEELRKPPPGWEEIVAAHEAERAMRGGGQNPALTEHTSSAPGDNQRFQKTPRPCRKFYTEDGCPYGDRCIFLHDDQGSQVRVLRESNAISLGPMTGQSNGNVTDGGSSDRSSNWKNRVCNKWETTGHCPFGQKCHFFHGASEPYSSVQNSKNSTPVGQSQRQGQKMMQLKWKGPADGISTIYGDWIEEDEWEIPPVNVVAG